MHRRITNVMQSRTARAAATLVLTGLCLTYIAWKIDLPRTGRVLAHANAAYFAGAVAIWLATVWPLAWRWRRLLIAGGVDERLGWLTRTYFVSYAAGQILPTSLGGDAARIYQGSRRHKHHSGAIVGSVLLERALGGAATLALAAIGFTLAVGRYEVGAYLWVELALVVFTVIGGFVIFSRSMRRPLARLAPVLRQLRVEQPVRAVYDGIHAYRRHTTLLASAFLLTLGVQAMRVAGIWLIGRSVGVELSPRPYYVMGPMLFLVMLVPFTISGLAVREAFFVSFLAQLGVPPDRAFSTGFLFFALAMVVALPGAGLVSLEALKRWAVRADLRAVARSTK